jgi:peptidoglycan/xylan/chitin deacetylase (PgdA/CDA1 family)
MMTVLVFHAVTDDDWFENVITWLKSRSRLVPIDAVAAYLEGDSACRNSCHITVDDGDESFARVMFPVLQRYGVHSSLFVSPQIARDGGNFCFQEIAGYDKRALVRIAADILNVPEKLLLRYRTENVLKSMSLLQIDEVVHRYRAGCDIRPKRDQNLPISAIQYLAETGLVNIGAHTMRHPILANESFAVCSAEIMKSIADLRSLLGGPAQYFAYPNGVRRLDFGSREEALLRNMGIKIAFTTESRHVAPSDNVLRIPRIAISNRENIHRIRAKMILGSRWSMLRNAVGVGENVERERLARDVNRCHSMQQ